MKRSIFLSSFFSTIRSGSNPLTSPAMRVSRRFASKRVMGPIPDRPAQMAVQYSGTELPTGVSTPSPVTTTRASDRACSRPTRITPSLSLGVVLDVLDRVPDRRDLLGILVRDLDVELLFEGHDQLDRVQRVGSQVFDELGRRGDVVLLDPELLDDDLLDPLLDRLPGVRHGRPLTPSHVQTAVDVNHLTRDVGRAVRGQEPHHRGDVLGGPDP